ncbi:MAG: minor capsid protein [Streptococcaceae bacterium]|jgi:SPP1 gp7 family putative phage head morphogenesis protein|nr:minor capsid protein [Streptococcaceae bacterium]
MAKKSRKLSYWEQRSVNQDITVHKNLDAKEKVITNAYLKAQEYLTTEVKKLYNRYLNKTDKTEAEIKQILNTKVPTENLIELKTLAKSVKDKELKKKVQDYLNGLAVKSRITRLEDLKAKSFLVSKQIADVQLRTSTDFYIDVINDAYNQAATEGIIGNSDKKITESIPESKFPNYAMRDGKPVIEITDSKTQTVTKTIPIEPEKPIVEFKELSTKYVNNILDGHWEGSNYSKRIWHDTDLLAKRLEVLFATEAMTGMSEQDMAKALSNEFQTSIGVARRLVRTEANYVAGQAKLKGWQEHGVDEYKLVVVLDLRTSSICQKKSNENLIYKVSEAAVNGAEGNYPPFHPWCRTVAIAYFGERSLQGNRTAIDPITGKQFKIKMSDTYREWENILIEKHGKKDLTEFKRKLRAA